MSEEAAVFKQRLGEAIRAARLERGWSQADLAEQVGIDRKTVNRIENGVHSTLVGTVYSIARALDRPPWELVRDAEKSN